MFEKASVFCPCFENSADTQLWPNEIRSLTDITRVSTLSTWGDGEHKTPLQALFYKAFS